MKNSKLTIRTRQLLIFNFSLLIAVAYADPLAENQARFGKITGTVQVLAQGVSHWSDAHVDLPIEVGDQIHVDEDSEAELLMAKNALWVAQANTDLIVGHTTTQEGQLTLTQGTLLGQLEPSSSGSTGPWEFDTPLGICRVRGTEFVLTQSDGEGMHLGVIRGFVELQPAENATQSFPSVVINTREEGVLQKKALLKKLTVFSAGVQAALPHFRDLNKRYQTLFDTWSPYTVSYRQELRRKYIAPAEHHPTRNRPKARRQSSGSN